MVDVTLDDAHRDRLRIACNRAGDEGRLRCAATLAMILEDKTALGLAGAPSEDIPWERLPESVLESRALAERAQRAATEKMTVKSVDPRGPWTDYTVASALSGKTYRVAVRGLARGESYCACPDFRKNLLGTCKHVLKVHAWLKRRFGPARLAQAWRPDRFAVFARYDGDLRLGLQIPAQAPGPAARIAAPWRSRFARAEREMLELVATVRELARAGESVTVYPDAEEILDRALHRHRLSALVAAIRKDSAAHPLRRELLRTELLPYQLDGIAFAVGAGRAVLADEMGLGKTIQGVGVAELLAREAGIERVLVVCPASLKSQWRAEIGRFSGRSVQLVAGTTAERGAQYANGAFFTICNYEQVLRDFLAIEHTRWDLIVLDEAQRIRNWEAKTSRIIKSLRSPFALALSGTPLENRLDDLYSVVEFIDDRRLGPAYRFIHGHRVASEAGRVLGYRNLDALRERLRPVLLRRTRASIALELPPRTTEIVRVTPTDEQLTLHSAQMQTVQTIVRKKFLTEMDLLRLQKALLLARMSANGTFLVDKTPPGYSSKLERLAELLEALCDEPARKLLVFSEWTTMLDLVEPILRRCRAGFVRLDGAVPQKERQRLVNRFQTDAGCRAFLASDAGSTGLNLQAADTVINLDLPWNPARLEQRIARAHRMGQRRPVQVHLLITEGTDRGEPARHLVGEARARRGRARSGFRPARSPAHLRHGRAEAAPRGAARRAACGRAGCFRPAARRSRGRRARRAERARGRGRRAAPCRRVLADRRARSRGGRESCRTGCRRCAQGPPARVRGDGRGREASLRRHAAGRRGARRAGGRAVEADGRCGGSRSEIGLAVVAGGANEWLGGAVTGPASVRADRGARSTCRNRVEDPAHDRPQ